MILKFLKLNSNILKTRYLCQIAPNDFYEKKIFLTLIWKYLIKKYKKKFLNIILVMNRNQDYCSKNKIKYRNEMFDFQLD